MQEILQKMRYFKIGLSKSFLKINYYFFNPIPLNGQYYQKQKRLGTSDQTPFKLPNKFWKIPLLVTYYLTNFYDVL